MFFTAFRRSAAAAVAPPPSIGGSSSYCRTRTSVAANTTPMSIAPITGRQALGLPGVNMEPMPHLLLHWSTRAVDTRPKSASINAGRVGRKREKGMENGCGGCSLVSLQLD
ncbi:hypothetical protein HPP92_027201 [Vanilla planifolia]|uniref:Uncharacterized protein n=1 Tax=Vanilla planifolia TaxID=51239 RepID=A0A835U4Z0_VANPL|nr:hypothetical protein HPP92_027201 [Vanilla planifolia]